VSQTCNEHVDLSAAAATPLNSFQLLRLVEPFVPLRFGSCLAAVLPVPRRCAVLLRSRTGQNIHVLAFATVLLTPVPSFGRFDEITDLVENASALTPVFAGAGTTQRGSESLRPI
jgi:hypothetical protein